MPNKLGRPPGQLTRSAATPVTPALVKIIQSIFIHTGVFHTISVRSVKFMRILLIHRSYNVSMFLSFDALAFHFVNTLFQGSYLQII